jgi:hypothetical protein
MKTARMALCGFFVMTIVLMPVSEEGSIFAQQGGCCKQRSSVNTGWQKNGLIFRDCDQANRRMDGGDNIFDPTGLIWWDSFCR